MSHILLPPLSPPSPLPSLLFLFMLLILFSSLLLSFLQSVVHPPPPLPPTPRAHLFSSHTPCPPPPPSLSHHAQPHQGLRAGACGWGGARPPALWGAAPVPRGPRGRGVHVDHGPRRQDAVRKDCGRSRRPQPPPLGAVQPQAGQEGQARAAAAGRAAQIRLFISSARLTPVNRPNCCHHPPTPPRTAPSLRNSLLAAHHTRFFSCLVFSCFVFCLSSKMQSLCPLLTPLPSPSSPPCTQGRKLFRDRDEFVGAGNILAVGQSQTRTGRRPEYLTKAFVEKQPAVDHFFYVTRELTVRVQSASGALPRATIVSN